MSSTSMAPTTASPRGLLPLLRGAWQSWATRSLVVGFVATVLDIAVGMLILHWAHGSTRLSAMSGVAVGALFSYVANHWFAFRDHDRKLASSAIRFFLATAVAMLFHGQVVVLMADRWGVPFPVAKVLADLLIFTVGQLLVLRYLVFPRARKPEIQARSLEQCQS